MNNALRYPFDTIQIRNWITYYGDTIPYYQTLVSPNSERVCIAAPHCLILWKLNRQTGDLYDSLIVQMPASRMAVFSPNSNLLYCPSADTIFQLDLSNWDGRAIRASRVAVGRLPLCPSPQGCETPWATLSDGKVAVNGKLYLHIAHWRPRINGGPGLDRDWPTALSVIHCPDVRGVNCGFELDGQTLFGKKANSMLPVHDQSQVADAWRLQLLSAKRRLCAGDTTRIWAFGAGAERFSWQLASGPTGGAGLLADTGAQAVFTGRQAGVYTVSVRGVSRCSVKDTSLQIEVLAAPASRAIPDTLICPPATLFRLGRGLVQAGVVYRWQRLAGTGAALSDTASLAAQLSLPVADTASQRFSYALAALDTALGCATYDTVHVRLGPEVGQLLVADHPEACQGDTVHLGPAGPAHYVYTWSGAPGVATPDAATTPLVLADTATDAFQNLVLYRETSAEGCSAVRGVRVTAWPLPPRIHLSGPAYVCPGSTAVPYQLLADSSTQPGPWHYLLSVSGGDSVALTQAGPGPTATAITSWPAGNLGPWSISATLTSSAGCQRRAAALSVSVTRRLHPRFSLVPGLSTLRCFEPGLTLGLSAQDAVSARSYAWALPGLAPDSATGAAITVAVPAGGPYPIRLYEREATPAATCQGDTVVAAFIYPQPTPPRILCPDTLCLDVPTPIQVSADSNGSSTLSASPSLELQPQPAGWQAIAHQGDANATLTAQTESGFGCLSPVTVKPVYLRSLPIPLVTAPPLPLTEAQIAAPVTFVAQGRPASRYLWTVEGGDILSGQGTPTLEALFSGQALAYAVSVQETDHSGCTGVPVRMGRPYDSSFSLPNVITPNGDGLNDRLTSPNLRFYPDARLEVFSKWGQRVFSEPAYPGSFEGAGQPAGTYYFRLSTDRWERRGWVEVVK